MNHALAAALPTLPFSWYLEPVHFQRELDAIWYRDWVYAGRESLWARAGDFRVVTIGTRRVVVVRGSDGELRAFLDSCAHRGSALCTAEQGRFATGRITCPYHQWSYGLDGALISTPRRPPLAGFDPADHGLQHVALARWGGFVFINLDPAAGHDLDAAFAVEMAGVSSWPLDTLQSAHCETHVRAFNWKVFWDNYLECVHCPGVHPQLCDLIPVYGTGQLRLDDASGVQGSAAEVEPRLRDGARTWTTDGQCRLPEFADLDPQAIAPGMRFATFVPSVFMVAHRDYVRTVSVRPIDVGHTEVSIEWLVHPGADPAQIDLAHLTDVGRTVVLEDARVSEFAQRGMHARPDAAGVLMPQEYDVRAFQTWVAARLRGDALAAPVWEGDVRVQG
jgi:Rieske 2Fe-2S family protein